ncbi:MAG: Sigma 54 interacting domain protein [Planctomycetaceae bacterium]|nr:Sigma 54 interacting domain protein [Planctomycetaceae bacterium]
MESFPEPQAIIGDPKRLLLELAGRHQLLELLPFAVRQLAAGPTVALVRIWLLQPPLSGDCAKCRLAAECANREQCLHLVASAGHPLDPGAQEWDKLNGLFRRFPLGIRKVGHIAATGKSLEVLDIAHDQNWVADPEWVRDERIVSFAGHPLMHRGQVLGVLGLFAREQPGAACFEWLRMIADHLAAAIANARALAEIEALKRQLEQENEYLREEVLQRESYGELVGQGPALQAVARQIDLVAPTDSSVLILGESGTGKELVARELHRRSRRSNRPFIKVNCAAIPRELYESEFFGHTKGSFTGALRDRVGRFELADGGTLFLDEVGEIPLDLQAKLLRVLQEGELERVGDERTRRVDVRVISATNRKLRAESEAGRFRQDLYYRLSVFPIELPPLRNRVEDIPLLADQFLERLTRKLGQRRPRLTLANVQQLQQYSWPGNVRELQHVLERASIGAPDGRLRIELPSETPLRPSPLSASFPVAAKSERILTEVEMRAFEADNIRLALEATGGKIYGRDGAAAQLGVKPTTLASRIHVLGISIPR